MASEILQEATKRYTIEDSEINPISEIDAEFIHIVIDVISQRGWNDLADILKEYKKLPDEDVMDLLAEYSIAIDEDDIQDQPQRKSGQSNPREFLEINGRRFRTFAIFNMRPLDFWDDDKEGPVFAIMLNEGPLPGSAQWYVDTQIPFPSKQDRDKEYLLIKKKLEKQNCTFV